MKAFETVSYASLWKSLKKSWCPDDFMKAAHKLHGLEMRAPDHGQLSQHFTGNGTKQDGIFLLLPFHHTSAATFLLNHNARSILNYQVVSMFPVHKTLDDLLYILHRHTNLRWNISPCRKHVNHCTRQRIRIDSSSPNEQPEFCTPSIWDFEVSDIWYFDNVLFQNLHSKIWKSEKIFAHNLQSTNKECQC